jgi:hypothetical protein
MEERPMEALIKLFGRKIVFIYHCFDRIVINGYLSMLSRPDQIVYFFKTVLKKEAVTKEVLSERTKCYNGWVESFSRNNKIPLEWAEKKVRKEDHTRSWLKKIEKKGQYGVYFIYKSMEQGSSFRSMKPKYKTKDPNYYIIKGCRSRFTHYYFYIRDELLGPISIRVASFLPFQATCWLNGHNIIESQLKKQGTRYKKDDNAFISIDDPKALQEAADQLSPELIEERLNLWLYVVGPKFSKKERKQMNLGRFFAMSQIEYCANAIFQRNFSIRKLFLRSCELGLYSITADRISNFFGTRITKRFNGKLHTVFHRMDHSHHTLRAYFKNSFIKQYEKLRTFLRVEVVSNNTRDLRVKKSLKNLPVFKEKAYAAITQFVSHQAYSLDTHVDFPLFQRIALPITHGKSKLAGIKMESSRMIRLMETTLHFGSCLNGWQSGNLHERITATYHLSGYTINQLRYDLRKMKAHGLVDRVGNQYSYRLTDKGIKVASMFVLFHRRVCGPLANSLFYHKPNAKNETVSPLERAYQKADHAVDKILEILMSYKHSERQSLGF